MTVAVLLRFLLGGFFECITENLACALHAFCAGVDIHAQCGGRVRMTEFFRDAGDIRAVCDGDTREAVTQLVRVQVADSVPFGKLLQISGGGLWVHRLCTAVLREYKGADDVMLDLLSTKLL